MIRHATVNLVSRLLGHDREGDIKMACDLRDVRDVPLHEHFSGAMLSDRLRDGKMEEHFRITCDRCAIIVDAALEGVKPRRRLTK